MREEVTLQLAVRLPSDVVMTLMRRARTVGKSPDELAAGILTAVIEDPDYSEPGFDPWAEEEEDNR